MKSIAKSLSLALILLFAFLLSTAGAGAQKKFTIKKTQEAKPPLGENTITKPSGLQYKDVKVGTGASPKKNSIVWVHYTGWLMKDGTKFYSTRDLGMPYSFIYGFGLVIPAWEEALADMKVGGKRTILVPPALGYGSKGLPNSVPPNATLKYELELVSIGPKQPK